MSARIVFMGSPEFAVPTLQNLAIHFPVVGVVTQPDRPSGRGRQLTPPPIKDLAINLNIPLIQPARLRETFAMEQLRSWDPELIVVAAFGQILRPEVLSLPHHGCINVHASLLPRWRGAAPIQAAIFNGDNKTGITIMLMDPGIDTGPILSQREESIFTDDTAETLSKRLANLGAELLLDTLPGYLAGHIHPQKQNDDLATYAPMFKKEDGLLDFNINAEKLVRQVNAFHPWPGTYTIWKGENLKILKAHHLEEHSASQVFAQPGKQIVYGGLPAYTTGGGLFIIDLLQPAGKKPMSGYQFLLGAKDWGNQVHG